MKNELPINNFFDGFYFWFDKENKYEYYATPLYLYKANTVVNFDNKLVSVYWNEAEKTDNGLKHPATLYFPYVQRFGTFLLRFLNCELSSFEDAYKTFFYAYGFEILKDLDENFEFELKGKYENDENYLSEMENIFSHLQAKIKEIKFEINLAIDYIYNLDDIDYLKNYTIKQRYATYLIKRKNEFYKYGKNDYVFKDSYVNKYDKFKMLREDELLENLANNPMLVSMQDTHKSNDLSSICFAMIEELVQTENYPIKKCKNCGLYFIPTSRLDEIYCDYPKENDKTCRDLGAFQSYTERLKNNRVMGEYRRSYQTKFAQAKKNPELKADFEKWKVEAKELMNRLKHGDIEESEVLEWILENK